MDWQQYEDEMIATACAYTLTEFLGRGKYQVVNFINAKDCAKEWSRIRAEEPHRRVLMYAVCQPPNRAMCVNVPINSIMAEQYL